MTGYMQIIARLSLISSLATATAASVAFGQSTASSAERISADIIADSAPVVTTLPEIVVNGGEMEHSYTTDVATSATRLPEPILDTPRSVEVVTPQVIKDRKITDPQEAVQNVSGVQRGGSRTGAGETYIIRGFQQQSLIKDGFRAGELSGSALFTFEGPTDMANIERIEVLKGPSSILYGRGEPGGSVNYITKQALFENRFSLEQNFGSYDFYRTELGANWEAVPGQLALRLDTAFETSNSFIDFVNGERFFIAPAFNWQISEDTALTFRGEYTNDDHSSSTGLPYVNGQVVPGMPYNRYFGEPGVTNIQSEDWRGLLQLEHHWNDGNLTTISLQAARKNADGMNFILYNFGGPLQDPVTGDITRSAEDFDFTNNYFTARVDHVWETTLYEGTETTLTDKDGKTVSTVRSSTFPEVKNQLLLSAEFERQTTDGLRILSGQAPLNPTDPHYTGFSPLPLLPGFPLQFTDKRHTEAESTSLLIHDRISVGDTVYLTFGGRLESFRATSRYAYQSDTPFGSADNKLDVHTFDPSVGLVVKPTRNISLYASYAESTYSFKNIDSTTASGDQLDPERARQYETGVKFELFGGKLFTTLSAFQIEKTDVATTDPNNPFFVINAGKQRSRGLEFDLAGEPIPGWRVLANYAYLDATISSDPLGINLGNRLPGVPINSGGFFTTYEIQGGALKGLGFGGGAYFSDRVKVDVANSGSLSGWAQADAVVYYRRDRFQVQFNVKNLFDSQFYYADSGGGEEVQRAAARTFIGSIKYEF